LTYFDPDGGNVSFLFEYDIEGFVDRLFDLHIENLAFFGAQPTPIPDRSPREH
jgi:hypothetical protein